MSNNYSHVDIKLTKQKTKTESVNVDALFCDYAFLK
jgi:hypothetical protein